MVVRGQRENIQSGQKEDKRFEDDGGRSAALADVARLYSEGIHVEGVRGESHSVTSGDSSKGESCQEL